MLLSSRYKDRLVVLVVDEAHCVKLWGDQFRKAFALIGSLRSLLPSGVPVLALTATALMDTYQEVLNRLSMKNPNLIALPPDRSNIVYSLHPIATLQDLGESLYKDFTGKDVFPKTILFVRKYKDCADLYSTLLHKLGHNFTHPPGYPNTSEFRVVEMFSGVLTTDKKNQVLSTFSTIDSSLRLVIATSAFGLGIDISDIRRVIHWGLPSSIEEYVQEAGRAGRDGHISHAILYEGHVGKSLDKRIKDYQENTTICRRRFLFKEFLKFCEKDINVYGCSCCDVCARECSCENC